MAEGREGIQERIMLYFISFGGGDAPRGLWDLSSLPRDWTCTLHSESTVVLTTGPSGNSLNYVFLLIIYNMTVYNMVSGKLSKTTRLSQNCLNRMCIRKKWKLVSQNVNNDCFQVLKIWMIPNPSSHFTMIKFCAFFIMEKYIHDKMQCFKIGFEFFRSLSSKKKTGFFS